MATNTACIGRGLRSSITSSLHPHFRYANRQICDIHTVCVNIGPVLKGMTGTSLRRMPGSWQRPLSKFAQSAPFSVDSSLRSSGAIALDSVAELERSLAAATDELDDDSDAFLEDNDGDDEDEISTNEEGENDENFAKVSSSFMSIMGSQDSDDDALNEQNIDPELLVTNFGLSDITVEALHRRGIKAFFAIQKAVFDPAMEGKDIIARAKTGSGKTLAFALPIIEKIMAKKQSSAKDASRRSSRDLPSCLVLAPTRELARQVEREFISVAPNLAVGCFYGGTSIVAHKRQLRRGVDIAVGTPGRVIDLLEQQDLDLSEVKHVILDEADQMLNIGFAEDVERILQDVPTERQTLLFSATIPKWVRGLINRYLQNPVDIDLVGRGESGRMNESITALAVEVSYDNRRKILVDLLTVYRGGNGKAIVFTQRKRDADEVAAAVAPHHPCEPLHGDMAQAERERVLRNFRDGRTSVLVATDVAARGLDIPNVDLVIHHEPPMDAEAYLHRSGRTGRAGKSGTAIAMYGPRKEKDDLKRILRETNTQGVRVVPAPTPEQILEAAARATMSRLDGVSDDVRSYFAPVARMVLDSKEPQEALEAALAALSGITSLPEPRSLLTGVEGFTTLSMMAPSGRIVKPGNVYAIVTRLMGDNAADEIGKIRMLSDDEGLQGAAFDLPNHVAKAMLEKADELSSRSVILTKPTQLEESHVDLYSTPSRNSGRDSWSTSRRGRGRESGFGSRGRGRSSSRGSWDNNQSSWDRFDRPGRSKRGGKRDSHDHEPSWGSTWSKSGSRKW